MRPIALIACLGTLWFCELAIAQAPSTTAIKPSRLRRHHARNSTGNFTGFDEPCGQRREHASAVAATAARHFSRCANR